MNWNAKVSHRQHLPEPGTYKALSDNHGNIRAKNLQSGGRRILANLISQIESGQAFQSMNQLQTPAKCYPLVRNIRTIRTTGVSPEEVKWNNQKHDKV